MGSRISLHVGPRVSLHVLWHTSCCVTAGAQLRRGTAIGGPASRALEANNDCQLARRRSDGPGPEDSARAPSTTSSRWRVRAVLRLALLPSAIVTADTPLHLNPLSALGSVSWPWVLATGGYGPEAPTRSAAFISSLLCLHRRGPLRAGAPTQCHSGSLTS